VTRLYLPDITYAGEAKLCNTSLYKHHTLGRDPVHILRANKRLCEFASRAILRVFVTAVAEVANATVLA
jgi:hypothetical protein